VLIESIHEAIDELNQVITAADKLLVRQLLAQLTDEWQQLEATRTEVYLLLTDLEENKLEFKWFIDQREAAIIARVRAMDCLAGYLQVQQTKSVVPVSFQAECVNPVSTVEINSQAVAGNDITKVLWLANNNQDFSSSNTTTVQNKTVAVSSSTTEGQLEADSSESNQNLSSVSSLNLHQQADAEVHRAASASVPSVVLADSDLSTQHAVSEAANAASADLHDATLPNIKMSIHPVHQPHLEKT